MLRVTIAHRTSWWKCFVDGTNPQDQGRKLVSEFLKSQKIDPYKLDHAMINDYKRWLLLEIHDPIGPTSKGRGGPKAIQLGKDRLAELRRFELMRLRRDFPLIDNS
jgi:hypothetical protein